MTKIDFYLDKNIVSIYFIFDELVYSGHDSYLQFYISLNQAKKICVDIKRLFINKYYRKYNQIQMQYK